MKNHTINLSANQNSFVANRLVAFITDSNYNLYDSREENLSSINSNLQQLISNVNYLTNDYNQNLVLFDTLYIAKFQILQYNELFQFYVTNKYLSISPNDLIKISTWLNEEWGKYLNSFNLDQQSSILIINNQLYFDNG